MKVSFYNWCGTAKNLPDWFKHQEEGEVTWEQIQELYATGNNIMLMHHSDGSGTTLAVDDRRFGQR